MLKRNASVLGMALILALGVYGAAQAEESTGGCGSLVMTFAALK